MDGENKGNPYFFFLMDDVGGFPPIFGNTHMQPLHRIPQKMRHLIISGHS